MPHRTRVFFPPQKPGESPKALAQTIHDKAFTKQNRKKVYFRQEQHEIFRSLKPKSLNNSCPR
jgi:hypothetical protein